MRYIIIAFVFFGLVFYEMSGGADFDPEATRLSRIEAPAAPRLAAEQDKLAAVLAETPPALPENVTRIALDLNTVQDVVRPARTRATALRPVSTALDQPGAALSQEPPAAFLPSLVGDTQIDTENLIDSSAITVVDFSDDRPAPLPVRALPAEDAPVTATDIRSVSGSSVNVRGGPGTDYAVVNRLVLGDEVEVLQDPGAGWVQMRPLGGGPVGWMATFLLSDG